MAQNLLQPCDSICGLNSYSTFAFTTVTKAIMNQVYPSLLYATKRMKKLIYNMFAVDVQL